MAPVSDSLANSFLGVVFCQTQQMSASDELWAAVGRAETNADGKRVFVEHASKNNYARELVAVQKSTYPDILNDPTERGIVNKDEFNFHKAIGGPWDRVNAVAFYSSKTGGEPRFWADLTLSESEKTAGGVLVEEGAALFFEIGAFKVSIAEEDVPQEA